MQKKVRNDEIQRRYTNGESISQLAHEFGLTVQRALQIAHQKSQ